jgi:serine/threonine-protein kinase HipA
MAARTNSSWAPAGSQVVRISFKDQFGELITNFRPVQQVVPPFFSNLLPEGPLRKYLAERAGVGEQSEFFLLWLLGRDLPGAVSVHPVEGEELPPQVEAELTPAERNNMLRFSLAGVQLKFSALKNGVKAGGLVIPAEGVGGSWIVKLPSQQYSGVPENEYSMMTIAKRWAWTYLIFNFWNWMRSMVFPTASAN